MNSFGFILSFESVRWVFNLTDGATQYIFKIDLILRPMRASYGFVNTLLVFILIKPFHTPILNFKDNCLQHIGVKKKGQRKN